MKQETGDPNNKIWLIGDSSPKNWKDVLKTPFDPRHPIRHNIWTSIIDVVQDNIYRTNGQRIDDSKLFIRNAIYNPDIKPKGTVVKWDNKVLREVNYLKILISKFKPVMVLSFGAFSFEFSKRANNESDRRFTHWGSVNLGIEFKNRSQNFDPEKTNILPLLHRSIAGGHFIKSHENFCRKRDANYFSFVGDELAKIFINHKTVFKNWV